MNTPEEGADPSILDACETLHMASNGSMTLDPMEADRVAAWLRSRLASWKPSPRPASLDAVYDSAVHALVQIALVQYDTSRRFR